MTTLHDSHLQRTLLALEATTASLTDAEWLAAPPGHWNAAQIVEHLAKAYEGTAYIFEKCLADDAPKGTPPTWRQRLFALMVVEAGWLPTGVKAPERTHPAGLSAADALALARRSLAATDVAAARCETRFGPKALLANHPLLGGFTVRQWRRFHLAHTRHHMRQIAARQR